PPESCFPVLFGERHHPFAAKVEQETLLFFAGAI
ncbi:unnamed protein product, partial [marine sediment metagenome]